MRVTSVAKNAATEIRVADAGPGVPSSMRESIFDAFVQLEAKDLRSTPGGRGLGLAFCKLAIEAHGGRIGIEDANPGAVFVIRIPHDS